MTRVLMLLLAATDGGSPLEARVVEPVPLPQTWGTLYDACSTTTGWVFARFGRGTTHEVLVDNGAGPARVVLPETADSVRLFRSKTRVWARFDTDVRGRKPMAELQRNALVPLEQAPRLQWVVESPRTLLGIRNEGETQLTERWQVWSFDRRRASKLGQAQSTERAVGAAWWNSALWVAVAGPDNSGHASMNERVAAVTASMRGDFEAMTRLAGQPAGFVLTLRENGSVVMRDQLVQRPTGLVVTDDGWLVVLTEGTLANGLRDAMMLARPPGEKSGWQRLVTGLEMPGQLMQRGQWVCFGEMPGAEARVAHCLNPTRSLYVKTPPVTGNLVLYDFEQSPVSLVFNHLRYDGQGDRLLRLPL